MRSRTRSAISPAAGRRRRGAGLLAGALTILATTWLGVPPDARADAIVLKGDVLVEGAIVHATRNTVVVRRAIGGMHQMSMEDIQEVRLDLAQGRQVSGQMLSWADGVCEIRAGGEVIRVGEGRILSRAPDRAEASRAPSPPPREQPAVKTATPRQEPAPAPRQEPVKVATPRREGPASTAATPRNEPIKATAAPQQEPVKVATAPHDEPVKATTSSKQPAVKTAAAPGMESDKVATPPHEGPAKTASAPRDEPMKTAAAPREEPVKMATARRDEPMKTVAAPSAARRISVAKPGDGVVATRAVETAAAERAESDDRTLTLSASVEAAEAGGGMLFNIELSRPAEQTIVLIYGTVDGTARAGTDYEPRQGVLTLSPGTRSTQVHVPLIDHQIPQEDTRFDLFLAADPKVVEVVDQRITATIPGDR